MFSKQIIPKLSQLLHYLPATHFGKSIKQIALQFFIPKFIPNVTQRSLYQPSKILLGVFPAKLKTHSFSTTEPNGHGVKPPHFGRMISKTLCHNNTLRGFDTSICKVIPLEIHDKQNGQRKKENWVCRKKFLKQYILSEESYLQR